MPYPKRKYRKGYTIHSESELANEIQQGHWLYYREKAIHPSFIGHMTFFTVMGGLKVNVFHYAIDQHKEYSDKKTEELLRK